ncbi:hypothetical protein MRY87_02470 [bacterium]|nr:hypothetical protein [bacterium]
MMEFSRRPRAARGTERPAEGEMGEDSAAVTSQLSDLQQRDSVVVAETSHGVELVQQASHVVGSSVRVTKRERNKFRLTESVGTVEYLEVFGKRKPVWKPISGRQTLFGGDLVRIGGKNGETFKLPG